jgi:hypothetical protein
MECNNAFQFIVEAPASCSGIDFGASIRQISGHREIGLDNVLPLSRLA